jgi:hypothetical protein
MLFAVVRRPGFRGTANASEGGSTPPSTASSSKQEQSKTLDDSQAWLALLPNVMVPL